MVAETSERATYGERIGYLEGAHEHVATKADLAEVKTDLTREIGGVETRLTGEIGGVRTDLTREIRAVGARMTARSSKWEGLAQALAEFESRIIAGFDTALAKSEARMTWRLIGFGVFIIAAVTVIDRIF